MNDDNLAGEEGEVKDLAEAKTRLAANRAEIRRRAQNLMNRILVQDLAQREAEAAKQRNDS